MSRAALVATSEAFFVDTHLFAFEFRRNTAHEDNGFCIANLCKQLLMSRSYLLLNVEAEQSKSTFLYIVYLDTVVLSCLDCQLLLSALDTLADFPDVDDGVSIHQ